MPRPVLLCVLALGLAACGRGPEPDEAADARRMMRVRPEEPGTAPETSPVPPPAVTPPAAAEAPAPEGRSAKAARAPHSREETGRPPAPPVPVPPLQLLDPPPAAAASEPRDFPDFAGVYEAASRSVIALEVSVAGSLRQGTAFFVDAPGRALTSAHVVEGGDGIVAVTADGRRLPARLLGMDRHTDLALLAVEGEDLPPPLALARRDARVGEWVLAIGNPLGLAFSATRGIVSATGRGDVAWDPAGYADFIQTDAAINRGNSGGPLLAADGVVLGVCAAIDPDADRIGFAVPAAMARVVAGHLALNGRLVRSFLGVRLAEDRDGVRVVAVLPGSPAARAGLHPGDRVRTWQDEAVEDLARFRWRVATTPPDHEISLAVDRGAERLELTARTEEIPERPGR